MMIRYLSLSFAIALFMALCVTPITAETTSSAKQKHASGSAGENHASLASTKSTVEQPALVVYYFHGHVRCTNCINFEHFTDELLKRDFAKDLQSGRIAWKVVNVDLPENQHFVDEFNLYTKSLVLVPQRDGKNAGYKNLTKIWQYAGDKAKFQEYVKSEIEAALKGSR
jgi:hypothetical protein